MTDKVDDFLADTIRGILLGCFISAILLAFGII